MKKRIGAAILAASLILTMALPTLAAPAPVTEEQAAQVVSALGIMAGDGQGNMNLSAQVTREQFVTMAVKATPGGEQVGQAATSPYPDVPRSRWSSGYVEAGVAAGLISGYSNGTFRPENKITLAEGATIVLQLLGYGPTDFSGAYPTGQLAMYRSLKLDQGVSGSAPTHQLTRRDAMYLFYNLMTAPTKAGQVYLQQLGHSLNAVGEIDLVALMGKQMDGPMVAQGSWQSQVGVELSKATVYRNGQLATTSAIQEWDVVYWNSAMSTIWAYSDKVTGSIQALAPSAANPTSVTVAGRTCTIETAGAAYALSNLGQYNLGDTVTLLLGRTGGVAALAQGVSAQDSQRVGLVTAVENASYSDGKGGSYTAQTVTLLSTDGQSYRYQHKSTGMKAGSVVQATVSGKDGTVTLKGLSSASLSGKVNSAGTALGGHALAAGVEILDVSEGQGVRVFADRLAGISLDGADVKYYALNGNGEIDKLILQNVTGDMHQYGMLTELTTQPVSEFTSYYTYEFDIGGMSQVIAQSTTRFPVQTGPIQVKEGDKLYNLTSAGTGEVNGTKFTAGNKSYTLWDSAAVYEWRNGKYYLSTLSRVQAEGYTLTGWYDKAESEGGRLRVIVARDNERS